MSDLQERVASWFGVGLRDQRSFYDGNAVCHFRVLGRDDLSAAIENGFGFTAVLMLRRADWKPSLEAGRQPRKKPAVTSKL